MSADANIALYKEVMDRIAGGDMSAFVAALDDDVVWWQIGSSEPIRGKEALVESMQGMEGIDLKVEVHDVLANDEHLVGLVTASVETGGEPFTYRTAEIVHLRDGKVTERWAFSDDTQRIADFFSGPG